MSNPKLRVVAHVVCFPDQVETTKALLLGLIEPTRKEPGCITYDLLQNQEDPTEFTFVEEWESAEALEAHLATPHLQAAVAQLLSLAAHAADIRRYNQLA